MNNSLNDQPEAGISRHKILSVLLITDYSLIRTFVTYFKKVSRLNGILRCFFFAPANSKYLTELTLYSLYTCIKVLPMHAISAWGFALVSAVCHI